MVLTAANCPDTLSISPGAKSYERPTDWQGAHDLFDDRLDHH
jgi:hypothetical protein